MQGADTGHTPSLDGGDLCIGIVRSRFNAEITARMAESCIAELHALGLDDESIEHVTVPGALEIPVALMAMADSSAAESAARSPVYSTSASGSGPGAVTCLSLKQDA